MQPPMTNPPSLSDSQLSSVTASLQPLLSHSVIRIHHFPQSNPQPIHIHTSTFHLRSHDADEPLPSHSDAAPIFDSSFFDSLMVSSPRFRRPRPWTAYLPAPRVPAVLLSPVPTKCRCTFTLPLRYPDLISMYVAPGAVSPFVCSVVCSGVADGQMS